MYRAPQPSQERKTWLYPFARHAGSVSSYKLPRGDRPTTTWHAIKKDTHVMRSTNRLNVHQKLHVRACSGSDWHCAIKVTVTEDVTSTTGITPPEIQETWTKRRVCRGIILSAACQRAGRLLLYITIAGHVTCKRQGNRCTHSPYCTIRVRCTTCAVIGPAATFALLLGHAPSSSLHTNSMPAADRPAYDPLHWCNGTNSAWHCLCSVQD